MSTKELAKPIIVTAWNRGSSHRFVLDKVTKTQIILTNPTGVASYKYRFTHKGDGKGCGFWMTEEEAMRVLSLVEGTFPTNTKKYEYKGRDLKALGMDRKGYHGLVVALFLFVISLSIPAQAQEPFQLNAVKSQMDSQLEQDFSQPAALPLRGYTTQKRLPVLPVNQHVSDNGMIGATIDWYNGTIGEILPNSDLLIRVFVLGTG